MDALTGLLGSTPEQLNHLWDTEHVITPSATDEKNDTDDEEEDTDDRQRRRTG